MTLRQLRPLVLGLAFLTLGMLAAAPAQTPGAPPAALTAQQTGPPPTPCANDPVSRQFDFWIGDYNVVDPKGNPVGTNRIERSLDGCLLIENWTDMRGGTGKSFNTWNPGSKKWQQYWVASNGTVTFYEGEFTGGVMRFEGIRNRRGAEPSRSRLTFYPLDGGRVRQVGEITTDGGKTWTVAYDLLYLPKK